MDLDELSLSPDGERRVTVTARALLLTRDLSVQISDEEVFHPVRGSERPRWDHDTIFGGLGLSTAQIESWRGGRALDVASGLGVAPTELSVLGVSMDCVDLEVGDDHPSFVAAAAHLRAQYGDALRQLRELSERGGPRYDLGDASALLDRLLAHADTIASRYPAVSGRREIGNATTLAGIDDDTYDATLCGWLMVHLEPDEERRAAESLLRVTKPGGTVHIRAGYGDDAAQRIRGWLGEVPILHAEGDLVVLRKAPRA